MDQIIPETEGPKRITRFTGWLLMLLGAADLAASILSFRGEAPYLSLLGPFVAAGGYGVLRTSPGKARYWAVAAGLALGVVGSFHGLALIAADGSVLPGSPELLRRPRFIIATLMLLAALWVFGVFSRSIFPPPRTGFGRIADAFVKRPALAVLLGLLALSPMLPVMAAINSESLRQEIIDASGLTLSPDEIRVFRYHKSCMNGRCAKTASFRILSEDPPREVTTTWRTGGEPDKPTSQ